MTKRHTHNALSIFEMMLNLISPLTKRLTAGLSSGLCARRLPPKLATALVAAVTLICPVGARAALPVQHWSDNSGAQIYLITTPNLPMLDVQIDFDAGARRDPAERAGLSGVLALMMTKGYAGSADKPVMDENQMGEAWADLGASFTASASQDRMSFRLRTLTEPRVLESAMDLVANQLTRPLIDLKVFERERKKAVDGLRESLTQPGVIAGRAFSKALYPTHPYGALVTEQSLQGLNVDDLRAFYNQYVNPCTVRISMVGKLNKSQAEHLSEVLLSRFGAAQCAPLPKLPAVQALSAPVEQRIDFDSAQAHVLIGAPAIARQDPDYFPLLVGNYILGGGGFVSRLTEQVREKRGLSYSVYSYFSPAKQEGPFTVGLQTRPDQALQAVTITRQVLDEFVKKGPTPAELKAAKDNLIGGFPLRLDSNKKLLDNLSNMAWNDLPLNYLDTWEQAVERVRTEDINAAFKKHVNPSALASIIVGGKFEAR